MTTTADNGQCATLVVDQVGTRLVLRLGGSLDMLTVPDLRARITTALAVAPGQVIVDLTAVDFLGSTGLHLLVWLNTELNTHDRALQVVTGTVRTIGRALQITGLDQLLTLQPNLPSALAAGTASPNGSANDHP